MPKLKPIEERDPYAALVLDAFDRLSEGDVEKKPVDFVERRFQVVGSGRMEKIPEAEFDANPHCLADGWRVVARKNGYVYIGNGALGA